MIETIMSSNFWLSAIVPVSLLTLPIMLVGKATPVRSFMAAAVIYLMIILFSACNVPGPF
tara:strand:+ start:959 stop:1138 length:180 start_codon:yes stop_codon:yes gene_type:complete